MATLSNSSPRGLESYRQEECNLTVEKAIRNEHLRARTNVQQAKSIILHKRLWLITNAGRKDVAG
jgi:hypothetical protein